MRINQVTLTTGDLDAVADFYGGVLDLPVVSTADTVTVRVGSSVLTFVPGPTGPGCHHLAFDVPEDRMADARRWLGPRTPLLGRDGMDQFDGPGDWNSSSVYFTGPDGTVLELIARHGVPAAPGHGFGSVDISSVSEVGIAVPGVAGAARVLTSALGEPAFGPGSADFRPVGDVHGLLIVVSVQRVWFPTPDTRADGGPVTVIVSAAGGSRGPHMITVDGRGLVVDADGTRAA